MNAINMPQDVRTMTFELTAETKIIFANDYDSVAVRSDKEIGISEFSGKQIGDNGVLKCKENESVIYPNLIRKKYIYIVGTSGANVEIFVGNGLVVNPFKKTQKGGDDSDKLPQYAAGYSGFIDINRNNSEDMYSRLNSLPFITNTGEDLSLEFCMKVLSGRTHAGRYLDFDNGTFVIADEYSDGHYYLEIKCGGEWRLTESSHIEIPQDVNFMLSVVISAEDTQIFIQKENGDSVFYAYRWLDSSMLDNLTSGNTYFFDSTESNRHVDGKLYAFRKYRRALTMQEITANYLEDMRLVAMANRLEIIKQPEDITASVGATVVMEVEVIGENVVYQWQYKFADSETWVNWSSPKGNQAINSRIMKNNWEGMQSRCIITDRNGNSIISSVITFTVSVTEGQKNIDNTSDYENYDDLKSDNDERIKVKEIDDIWK